MEEQTLESVEIVEKAVKAKDIINHEWDMGDEAEEQALREKEWKVRTGLNEETLQGAVEALIFMSDKPLSIQKIKRAIDEDIPLRFIYDSIEKLQEIYDNSKHGLKLMEVAEGYQFRTKIQYGKFIANIHKAPTITLSPLSLEVLAIIAFKQPISKIEVDQMRGVDSGHLIRGLMDKQLVKVIGRSQETGQPSSFGTTDEFLELFNVNTLDDLPSMHDLQELVEENAIGDIENIKELVKTEAEKFKFDDLSELDAIKESIKNIKADTEFTKQLKDNSKKARKALRADSADAESTEGEEEVKTAFDLLEEAVFEAIEEVEPTEEGELITEQNLEALEEQLAELETSVSADASPSVEDEQLVESETERLFDDEQDLSNALENAFDEMQNRAEEVRAVEAEAEAESETEEEIQDELSELDGFEIDDLSNIQEKLSDLEDSDEKDFS